MQLAELRHSGSRLIALAQGLAGAATVPSCPGWTVADLMRHVHRGYQRAIYLLGEATDHPSALPALPALPALSVVPPADESIAAALARLVVRLAADKSERNAASERAPAEFWTRRMAHETAIHRIDLELTADTGMLQFESDFAADGIEELLGWAPARFDRAGITTSTSITVLPLDVNHSWTVRLSPAAVQVLTPAHDGAALTVTGMATDLYRWVWNRAGDDEVSLDGRLGLADQWRSRFALAGEGPERAG